VKDIESVRTFDDALLRGRDIETGYGDLQVLYGVDIDIREDEIVLVFGPNGAGKSTLVKALCKLLPLWEGSVTVAERDVSERAAEEMIDEGICYVPQTENVFPNLTIDENLDIGGIRADEPKRRKEELFELFPQLRERQDQQAETLSGGERQMLAMARALMPKPDVLLVDEPSAGLSPQLVDRAFNYIRRVRDAGTAVLLVEQNVKAGLEVADRGYVLDMGEKRFEGPADALLDSERVRDLYLGRSE
jgi:branched-chain amino acid transport system ATP-binding protein